MGNLLPRPLVERMLSGHAGLGVAAGALLYILCLTGTIMVFHQELKRWEQPAVPEFSAAESVPAGTVAERALARAEGEHPHELVLQLPTEAMPRLTAHVVARDPHGGDWYAAPTGELVAPIEQPWTHFIESVHFYLTLPATWGLILVGGLGALMTALVITGLLAHPRMFRDAFRLRLGGKRLVSETDTHNRIGFWVTPFHLVIAVTGAALGLAIAVGMTSAGLQGEPSRSSFFDPVFGADPAASETDAPLPAIDTALARFRQAHPSLPPWVVAIHHPGKTSQEAKILAQHPDRLIFGDYYFFNSQGELTGNTGLSDGAIGQQVFASLYTLHFGSFGGLGVKLAYGLLGLLASVMMASGLNIWLIKRRQSGAAHPALERAWLATVWGTPATLALTLVVTTASPLGTGWLAAIFWLGLMACIVASLALPGIRWRGVYRLATALFLFAAVLSHGLQQGLALPAHAAALSLVLTTAAATLAWLAWRSDRAASGPPLAEPITD